MKKRVLLLTAALAVIATGVFAQEKYDGSKKNTIFFGPVAAGYERLITPALSAGAEAGINLFALREFDSAFLIAPSFADAFVRWYPWKRVFFLNLGLGYQGGGMGMEVSDGKKAGVFHIKPQIGWKVDIGKAGGWIFETRVGFGTTVGGDGGLITMTLPLLFGKTF
ncbi:MAG: hypothetical protein LBD07_01590 [Spirochaetaceae bacterium]|jgi:hypothetical protein|nr:hypothetical protein [Spirochaetaceae bacterium]